MFIHAPGYGSRGVWARGFVSTAAETRGRGDVPGWEQRRIVSTEDRPKPVADFRIERTYNSLQYLNGVEEGLEVTSPWVGALYQHPSVVEMYVSPGVVWINGERVVVTDPGPLPLPIPPNGETISKTIYVKNVGAGIGSIIFGAPSNATNIYAIGWFSVDLDEELFVSLSNKGRSLNTGIEYGDVKVSGVYHESPEPGYTDWTLTPGAVRIKNRVYRVNEQYLGQTSFSGLGYVILSPGANGTVQVTISATYPTASQFPEGYVVANKFPSRPLDPSVKFKEHKLGTGGRWRFNFEQYATHTVQSGASGYYHYLEFYTGDASNKEVIVHTNYPDLIYLTGHPGHTTKLEYLTGSLQYPAAAYPFDTADYNTDSGTVTCNPVEFELESLAGQKKIFRGVTTGFGRTDAVLTEEVDASGNRLVYEWVDGPNGYFKGIDGTDVPRDYRINRIYDDRDYNGPDSVQVLFSYNDSGQITSIAVTDASGNNREVVSEYTYNNDQLVGFTDFHGRSFVYDYDDDFDNLLLGVTDQTGGVLGVSYWTPGFKVFKVQSAGYSGGALGGFVQIPAPPVSGSVVLLGGSGPLNEQYFYNWENRKTTQVIAQVSTNTDSSVNVYTWGADVRANTNILEDRRILRKDVYKNMDFWGSYTPVTWKEWTYNPTTVMVQSVTDGNNRTTSYQYNSKRQIIQRTYPDGTSDSFNYGSYDNLSSKSDRNQNNVSFTYNDPVNPHLVTGISYQVDGVPKSKTFTFNPDGLLDTETDSEGFSVSYTYDAQGQLEAKSYDRTVWVERGAAEPAGHRVLYLQHFRAPAFHC